MNRIVRARLARAVVTSAMLGTLLIGGSATSVAGSTCLATGALDRDGTPLTARLVNPSGTVGATIDATGCDVGVYFDRGSGRVDGAEIFGARYFGVLVDGDVNAVSVDVSDSSVHDIGEVPLTSGRHGEGVAYRSFNGGSASGTVSGNRVWAFQEAGLNVTGPGSTVALTANRVIGPGPESLIEENGIQIIFGAHGTARANVISDLSFSGVGQAPSAGILDHANGDRIIGNRISGNGYDKAFCGGAATCTPIDVKHSIDPIVSGNVPG